MDGPFGFEEQNLESPFDMSSTPRSVAGQRVRQVWAIGGGKGGVGKSLISSSMAISLARMGNKVVAIDLDLGAANLHTTLGVDLPEKTLSDFISHRVPELNQCVTNTSVQNLYLISGASDSIAVANLPGEEKNRLITTLRHLDADYVIVDLGAGTNATTVDFFLYSDLNLLALLPEPTSIENAYRFIKTAYYRRLKLAPTLKAVQSIIDMSLDPKNSLGIRTPADLFREVNRVNPEAGMRLKEEITKFRPKIILNQVRTQTDVDIGFSIKTVTKRYFGIETDYIGYLDYDSSAWQAVRRKRPLMLEFPTSKLVSSIDRMTQYLLKRHGHVRSEF